MKYFALSYQANLIKRPDDRFSIRYVEATKGSECITTVIIIEVPSALHDPEISEKSPANIKFST